MPCPYNFPEHAERCTCLPPLGPSVHEVAEINRSIANNLAHEAGVMKARLEILATSAELAVDFWESLPEAMRQHYPVGSSYMAALRRAVARAALPIEPLDADDQEVQ